MNINTFRRALNSLNPFYRNPVQGIPDFQHLDARVSFLNAHLDRSIMLSALKWNRDVVDAIAELEGDFYLEAALVEGDLRVNVFDIQHRPTASATRPVFNPQWKEQGLAQYTLSVEDERAKVGILEGALANAFYDALAPRHSWTIPLDGATKEQLGLKISG